jgi:hypothetical protein
MGHDKLLGMVELGSRQKTTSSWCESCPLQSVLSSVFDGFAYQQQDNKKQTLADM